MIDKISFSGVWSIDLLFYRAHKMMYEDSNFQEQALDPMQMVIKEIKDLKDLQSKSTKKEDIFKLMKVNSQFNEVIISTKKQVIKDFGAGSPYFIKFMGELKTLKTTQNKWAGEFLEMLEVVEPKEFKQLKDTIPRFHASCCDNHHYECGGIYCGCIECDFIK